MDILPIAEMQMMWGEIGMAGVAIVLLAAYHLFLWQQIRIRPMRTTLGRNRAAWTAWVRVVISERQDILAVQNLRNWVTGASFLASTSMLLILAVVSALFSWDKAAMFAHALNVYGGRDVTTWAIKMLLLLVLFVSAFFNFTMAVRYFNHVAFLVTATHAPDSPVREETVRSEIVHGARHHTLGMRSYYLSIPVAFWIFGPVWMLASTVAMLCGLWRLDFNRD